VTDYLDKPESSQISIEPTTDSGENKITDFCVDAATEKKKSQWPVLLITVAIMLTSMTLAGIYRDEIGQFGVHILNEYGQKWVDVCLFLLSGISSTPLMLPVWVYVLAGTTLGLSIIRMSIVMGVGSAFGTMVTFYLGRYYGDSEWVKKRFPNFHNNRWTTKRSKKYITLILFLGNASLIPCDVLYVACGFKGYPAPLFFIATVAGRFVRYTYLGYIYLVYGNLL